MQKIFYKPTDAWAADPIPFYENGEFHIFYLLDWRDPINHGEGTPWYKVTTKDFVTYVDHGEMLKRGSKEEFDLYVFTGSVLKAPDGRYHIWYTGHNTHMEEGNYLQAVMHAVSDDLEVWKKIPEDTFQRLSGEYELRDWRDPFVWYDEKEKLYKMLLSTRKEEFALRRRGTTALLISKDNKKWEMEEPFYAPEKYYAHECPDLFKMGDWYYHIFSEFSHYHVTRYVMSKSLNGPWISPADDMFDGRGFYAAKTVSDGEKRYLIGWNPTKEGNVDKGLWQWGGSLVVHEIYARENGTLACKIPEGVRHAFKNKSIPEFLFFNKKYAGTQKIKIEEKSKVTEIYSKENYNGVYCFDFNFKFKKGTKRIGALLNVDSKKDSSYGFFFEPDKNRMIFELFPNFPQYTLNAICVERPIQLKPNKNYKVSIIIEDTICVAYVNDEYALNSRMYDEQTGCVGFMVQGNVEFNNICIKK